MLDSAFDILKHFTPPLVSQGHFDYFEIIRTDAEEVFYLCAIGGKWLLVFETDFIMNLDRTYREALEVFNKDFTIKGWITVDKPESVIDPARFSGSEEALIKIVSLKYGDRQLCYATMKLVSREPTQPSSSAAYGGVKHL